MAELRPVPGEERPRKLELEDDSLDEVLALGVVEHLAYNDARNTFENIHRILASGGVFVFDVPDLPVWCGYVVDYFAGKPTPFPIQHLLATLYGWQRWDGDEHRSGWYKELVEEELVRVGFSSVDYGVEQF